MGEVVPASAPGRVGEAQQLEAVELVADWGFEGETATAVAAAVSELVAERDRLTRLVQAYADTASELKDLAEAREHRLSAIEKLIGSFEKNCTTYGSEAHRLERLLYQLDNRAANAEAEASRARDDCERMRQSAVQQAEGLQTQLSQKERDVNAYSQRARDEADERCRLRKALTDTELELQRMKNVQSNCYFENASGKYGEVSHLDERSSEVADHDDRQEGNAYGSGQASNKDRSMLQIERLLQCGEGEAIAAVKAVQKQASDAEAAREREANARAEAEAQLKKERSKLVYVQTQRDAAENKARAAEGELTRRCRILQELHTSQQEDEACEDGTSKSIGTNASNEANAPSPLSSLSTTNDADEADNASEALQKRSLADTAFSHLLRMRHPTET